MFVEPGAMSDDADDEAADAIELARRLADLLRRPAQSQPDHAEPSAA